jgi:hypothetical protein
MAVAATQHSNLSYEKAQQQQERVFRLFSIGLGSNSSMLHRSKLVRAVQLRRLFLQACLQACKLQAQSRQFQQQHM